MKKEYENRKDAEDAIQEMNGRDFHGSKIRVEFCKGPKRERRQSSRSDYRVIVDNLAYNVSWQDLKDHMKKAGDVLFADIVKDSKGRSKVY